MSASKEPATDAEVLDAGMEALMDALGTVDAIRFMQLVHGTSGNYPVERHKWLDSLSLEDILADVDKLRAARLERDRRRGLSEYYD